MGAGGRATSEAQPSDPAQLMEQLSQETRFAPFFADEFNVASFASDVLQQSGTSGNVSQQHIERIEEGVALLDGVVRAEVTRRQSELLQQAAQLRDAELYLTAVNASVDNLRATLNRVRGDVAEPYKSIRSRTRQLQNLLTTAALLRQTTQSLKLLQKLRVQASGLEGASEGHAGSGGTLLDLAKAAKLISDVEAVLGESDITGVSVIDSELPMLHKTKAEVRKEAKRALLSGMDGLNQAEVGSALQVLFNLHELQQSLQNVLQGYLHQVEGAFAAALDGAKITAAASAAGGPSKVSEIMWGSLSKALQALQRCVVETCHLQRVLAKKRDPLTHVCFLDEGIPQGQPLPMDLIWSSIIRIVTRGFDNVASASGPASAVKEVLVASYPRLVLMLEDTAAAICRDTEVKGSNPPALSPQQVDELVDTSNALQSGYLSSSLQRMTDTVNVAFPGGTRALTSAAELQRCIARLHDEVKAVNNGARLSGVVAQGVGKALQLLASKAEYMAATGPDVRSVLSGCNASQQRNIALCNSLQEVHRSMLQLLQKLPQPAHATLRAPLGALHAAGVEVVTPVFRGMVDHMEELLLKVHTEDLNKPLPSAPVTPLGAASAPPTVPTSSYMATVCKTMAQWRSDYISKFTPVPSPTAASIAASLVDRMASRVLVFFVRHASLVRPLTMEGRVRLSKDAQELEGSVGQYLYPCEHLGVPFRMLRAFKALLASDIASLPGSPLLRELPASVVLHHLYMYLPPAVQSPHARNGLSASQYSVWLDQHTMSEAVAGINKALLADEAKASSDETAQATLAVMHDVCNMVLPA